MTEILKESTITKGLEELAELSKKDFRRDYTLGALVKETNKLTFDKSLLLLVTDEDLQKKATQAIDSRLNALYGELDRREKLYNPPYSGEKWL